MYQIIFTAILFFVLVEAKIERCRECGGKYNPVCGKDGNTYVSFCVLRQQECMMNKVIGFACDGQCPCDPEEVIKLDSATVTKMREYREKYQLEDHKKEEEEEEEKKKNAMSFKVFDSIEITDESVLKKLEKELYQNEQREIELNSDKYYKIGNDKCPAEEMRELPARLIDWFHVLKTNEKVKEYTDQGIEQEPILKSMDFINAKLQSMYSALACTPQDDDDIEKEVCLKPVQWMFNHLDTNNNKMLSATELYDFEQINNEHCVKPFLRSCDSNKDGKVVLKEFCKCLCITPPCTKIMQSIPSVFLNGEPHPVAGLFTPTCDEDGFFMPTQCNKRLDECWCVDRNGNEYEGTRQNGNVACVINTVMNPDKSLKPLDVAAENGKKLV